MNTQHTVLLLSLRSRRDRVDASPMRDAETVAYHILNAQSGRIKPTVAELVQQIRDNPAGDSGRQSNFNYGAWTELTEQVVTALRTSTPSKALGRVRVSTNPS